jgi:methionyl-tRNA formyltransferase
VAPAVKEAALARRIAVHQPVRVRDAAFRDAIALAAPEILVVVAYGRILPAPVLDAPPAGAVNVHFSLLPLYRGAAPVQWALARGEKTTGVTTMRIRPELDAGEILLQREVEIRADEHAPALQARLAEHGAELLVETLEAMRNGALRPRAQDAPRVTLAPVLRAADGQLDPAWSAGEVEGRVRGFDPWPGVWMQVRGQRIRIVEARASAPPTREAAGTIELANGGVFLACAGGTRLELLTLKPEGRRAMDAGSAVRGRYLAPGDAALRGASGAGRVVEDAAAD